MKLARLEIERLYVCLVQQKTLQALQGSAINKILNIPQCTLPPRPVYQTLLSDFSRVWLRDYHKVYKKVSTKKLKPSQAKLKGYSGQSIKVIREVEVNVCHNGQQATLPLVVVKGAGLSLLGRNWLDVLRLDWKEIHLVGSMDLLRSLLDKYAEVFKEGLGQLEGHEAKICVDREAQPKFCKARPIPYAMRSKVEEELAQLQRQGIITPVQFADWAAPIIPVLKADKKTVRICGDFKMTVNQASRLDKYPIPKTEDLFAKMSGGTKFTKLDLSQAY